MRLKYRDLVLVLRATREKIESVGNPETLVEVFLGWGWG